MTQCPCCLAPLVHPGWGPPGLGACAQCGSAFLAAGTAEHYDAEYFDGQGKGGVDYEASRRQFGLINRRRLEWMRSAGLKGGALLEIGCALGFFIEDALSFGWQGKGVEVSHFAAAKAKARLGASVFEGTLDKAPQDWRDFDLASGMHVLEHLPGPGAVLDDLHARLKPGAALAWEVPDFGSRRARRERASWQYFLPGEHLNYFTREGLRRLHQRHGFEVYFEKRCSFTRLLGPVDKAGLKGLRELILKNLRWLAWIKHLLLWWRDITGAHDCVFVIARRLEKK